MAAPDGAVLEELKRGMEKGHSSRTVWMGCLFRPKGALEYDVDRHLEGRNDETQ